MAKERIRIPAFDDIVFENRNKEYGAYTMRKKYNRTVMWGLLIGLIIMLTAVITPYVRAKTLEGRERKKEREVVAQMENLETPDELKVELPEEPPPPQQQQQVKYVAPEVVDTVKPEDQVKIMVADEAVSNIQDQEVVEVIEQQKEEVEEYEPPAEVFIVVEEMPSFPGGDEALLKFIYDNIKYPDIALENQIQGKVIVRFCVTYKGTIDQVSVLRGVDPALDAEAIRVVKLLPQWKPGKQGGKPVNVWYIVPITFQLQ
jgi:protein TonB